MVLHWSFPSTDGSPGKACLVVEQIAEFRLDSVPRYTWNNVTLRQPDERELWRVASRRAGVHFTFWSVETPHVALAQMPSASIKILSQALEEVRIRGKE